MNAGDIVLTITIGLLGVFGFIGNAKVLHKLKFHKLKHKTATHMVILASSLSYVIFILGTIPFRIIIHLLESSSLVPCQTYAFIDAVLFTITCHATIIAAFERHQRFTRPFQQHLSKRSVLFLLALSMLASISLAVPYAIENRTYSSNDKCLMQPYLTIETWHGISLLLVQLVLPLPCDIYYNISAWHAIHKQNLNCALYTNTDTSEHSDVSAAPSTSSTNSTSSKTTNNNTGYQHTKTLRHYQSIHAKIFCLLSLLASGISTVSNGITLILILDSNSEHYTHIAADILVLGKIVNATCNPYLYLSFGRKLAFLEKWNRQNEVDNSVFISASFRAPDIPDNTQTETKSSKRRKSRSFTIGEIPQPNKNAHNLSVPNPLHHHKPSSNPLTNGHRTHEKESKHLDVNLQSEVEDQASGSESDSNNTDNNDPFNHLETLNISHLNANNDIGYRNQQKSHSIPNFYDTPPPKLSRFRFPRSRNNSMNEPRIKRSNSEGSIRPFASLSHLRDRIGTPRRQHSKSNTTDYSSKESRMHQIILPVIVITTSEA